MGGTHQKGMVEFNLNEHKEVRNGLAGGGQGFSDEDESRINDVSMDLNEAHVMEAAAVTQIPVLEKLQQQQSLAPVVRWERFLPLRSLKVLLVENDDSTRQVVSALLRNCCYEVTAASNGFDAWRVLKDLSNHIDLVLTEVLMPGCSGIGLLCKIMSHKTCKTIPVIMMSSNDSMGIVFKCLSKGAVDFLVKPIRKNELKNLWQHVWRRCHSSSGSGSGSGSGSESGIQGEKCMKSKNEDDSGSNDEDNGSIGLSARDGSDNGSGTQSSWTKHAFEADSPQPMCRSGQLAGPHDSTCAQAINPKPEAFCSKKLPPMNPGPDWKEQKKINDDIAGTNLRNESNQTNKVSTKLTGPSTEKISEKPPNNIDVVHHTNFNMLDEPSARAPYQLDSNSSNTNQQSVLGGASKDFLKISESKDNGCVELPSLELSLKRLRSASIPPHDERNVLKHSNLSAFSRYPASLASVQAPTGHGGNSTLETSSEATPQNQGSNGSNINNIDKGSRNINPVTKPGAYKDVSTSAFHHVQSQSSTIQPVVQEMIDEVVVAPAIEQLRGSQKKVQVQHHHHHYHHYHHHIHASKSQPDQDGFSIENLKANAAYRNSSNMFPVPVEANGGIYSLNGSNSGSNHGSDGQNGGSSAINNNGGAKMEGDAMGVAEKSGVGGGNGSGNEAYQNRSLQREAALNKFRLKRKERNFGKKVRYQSRKRLAEQRPRVRGQFVRRIIHNENQEEDS